ncbi:hypothetical protein LXA43DRAFT_153938 [Ganoderma leucocontextum]|nr:hypothetical protein LXA43DRAFT_153938 [Ganoderma leucocontextum]
MPFPSAHGPRSPSTHTGGRNLRYALFSNFDLLVIRKFVRSGSVVCETQPQASVAKEARTPPGSQTSRAGCWHFDHSCQEVGRDLNPVFTTSFYTLAPWDVYTPVAERARPSAEGYYCTIQNDSSSKIQLGAPVRPSRWHTGESVSHPEAYRLPYATPPMPNPSAPSRSPPRSELPSDEAEDRRNGVDDIISHPPCPRASLSGRVQRRLEWRHA